MCSRAVQPEGQSQAQSHASHPAAESVGSVHSPPAPCAPPMGFLARSVWSCSMWYSWVSSPSFQMRPVTWKALIKSDNAFWKMDGEILAMHNACSPPPPPPRTKLKVVLVGC